LILAKDFDAISTISNNCYVTKYACGEHWKWLIVRLVVARPARVPNIAGALLIPSLLASKTLMPKATGANLVS
jgi:hypothetical protein